MADWDDDDWEAADIKLPGTETAAAPGALEEEDETVAAEELAAPDAEAPKPKVKQSDPSKAKKLSKQAQKEREARLAAEAERAKNAKPMTAEEREAEKARLQRLVEESDNALADELFGLGDDDDDGGVGNAGSAGGGTDAASIAARVKLGARKNYVALAQELGKRFEIEGSVLNTKEFLKEVLRCSCAALSDEDVVEIEQVLGVIKNTKVKTRLNKKKKNPKGKASVQVARGRIEDDFLDMGGGGGGGSKSKSYNAALDDEYDFM